MQRHVGHSMLLLGRQNKKTSLVGGVGSATAANRSKYFESIKVNRNYWVVQEE